MSAARALAVLALAAAPLAAAEPVGREPLFAAFRERFQKDYLRLGGLLQVVADAQSERDGSGRNGFSVANARLSLSGRLDGGFDYRLQVNFADAPRLLTARLGYEVLPEALALDAGQFKSPFSAEFLTSAASIDFVNRSQAAAALAPRRQRGVQARGELLGRRASWKAGVFNGNGAAGSGNDDNHFLYAARLSGLPLEDAWGLGRLEAGVNAAYSRDESAPVGGLVSSFRGVRRLAGADMRWTAGRWLLSGEAIYGSLSTVSGLPRRPWGFHATGGFRATPRAQALLRFDRFRSDGLQARDSDFLIAGWNFWPTQPTEIQVNYLVPTNRGSARHHQLLVNFQVAF